MDRTGAFVHANTAMRRNRDPIALTLGQNGALASKQISWSRRRLEYSFALKETQNVGAILQ
jgi:hypothetical protein